MRYRQTETAKNRRTLDWYTERSLTAVAVGRLYIPVSKPTSHKSYPDVIISPKLSRRMSQSRIPAPACHVDRDGRTDERHARKFYQTRHETETRGERRVTLNQATALSHNPLHQRNENTILNQQQHLPFPYPLPPEPSKCTNVSRAGQQMVTNAQDERRRQSHKYPD